MFDLDEEGPSRSQWMLDPICSETKSKVCDDSPSLVPKVKQKANVSPDVPQEAAGRHTALKAGP
jgi:hypothetical protein